MALDRYIHILLYDHDCVIVPEFGGFLAHYAPARLDVQRRLAYPPSKTLSFNRKLMRQDGLLADHVARHEGLDFQAAKDRLQAEVSAWKEKLQRDGRLELERIGTFFHDAEKNLQFIPDNRANFLKDAYGLRPVAAVPVPSTVLRLDPAAAAEARPEPAPMRKRQWMAAAAVAAMALTAATWYLVGSTELPGLVAGNLNLLRLGETPRYVLPAPPAEVEAPQMAGFWTAPTGLQGVHTLPIAGPTAPPVAVDLGEKPEAAAPVHTAVVAVSPIGQRFHIIGGCFLEKENADRMVAELQARGFAASVIDKKGNLYRVAYGSYPLRTTALEALNAVRKEEAPEAWLLVK